MISCANETNYCAFFNDWTLLQSNWSLTKILYWSLLGVHASVGHLCRGFPGKCVDTARNCGDRPGQYPLSLLCIFPQQFLGIYQWENITIVLSTQYHTQSSQTSANSRRDIAEPEWMWRKSLWDKCSSLKMKLITAKSCGKKARKENTPGIFCCSFLL